MQGVGNPSAEYHAAALGPYAAAQTAMLSAWMDLVAYLYDGRLVALLRAGRDWMGEEPGRAQEPCPGPHRAAHRAPGLGDGDDVARYSRGLLRLLGRHGLRGNDPREMAIQ